MLFQGSLHKRILSDWETIINREDDEKTIPLEEVQNVLFYDYKNGAARDKIILVDSDLKELDEDELDILTTWCKCTHPQGLANELVRQINLVDVFNTFSADADVQKTMFMIYLKLANQFLIRAQGYSEVKLFDEESKTFHSYLTARLL